MDASYFYTQFAAYNTDWLLVQVLLWLLLVISTVAVLAKTDNERTNMLVKAVLAVVCLWNAIVFFFLYMSESAIAGGIPFAVAGVLFAADITRRRIQIRLPKAGWLKCTTIAWVAWALGLYTLAGWLTGHPYPGGPLPTAPCPVTILAIALLSTSMPTLKTNRAYFTLLLAMLLWWAFFAGIFAPVLYGFWVDFTLLAAGIYGLLMIILHWKKQGLDQENLDIDKW